MSSIVSIGRARAFGVTRRLMTTTTTTTMATLRSSSLRSSARTSRIGLRTGQDRITLSKPSSAHLRRSRRSTTATSKRQKATLAPGMAAAETSSSAASSSTRQIPRLKDVWKLLEEVLRKPRTIPIPRWISPRHSTITLSEVFGHSSFILVAISYAVDDFLHLRIIAVAGSTAMLFFTYFHPHGRILWLPFRWNALFIAINSYRIGKVFMDRYFAEQLSEEFMKLRNNSFYLMDPVDFSKLVRLGTVREYKKGEMVVAQGENNRYVRLVLDGQFRVLRDGSLTYFLEEANFMSESGLHAGLLLPGRIESCCTVVADTEKARVLCWDRTELIELMQRDGGVRRSIKAILSWDIVRKLKAQRAVLASGAIDDPEQWTERRNRQTQHRYSAILHNVLSHPHHLKERLKEVNKYRMIHHIDDEHHNLALTDIGWTPAEFEAGRRQGGDEDDDWLAGDYGERDDELKHDWRWYLHDIYLRLFG